MLAIMITSAAKQPFGKKWETERWASDLSLGYNRTNYSQRLVDNQEKFSKDHWSLELGIFRELNQYWKTYAKWMHESDSSNDPDFAYESNFWSLGMAWKNETTQVQPSMVSIYLVRPTSDWNHFFITNEFPDSASPTNY